MKKKVLLLLGLILAISTSQVMADTGPEHILKGSLKGNSKHINVYYDNSLYSLGLDGSIDNARQVWNNASSAIGLAKVTFADADVKIYGANKSLPWGTWGATSFWDGNSVGEQWNVHHDNVKGGSSFLYARIILDLGRMSENGFTSQNRYHTAAHELGHALSMNHFENYPAHTGEHLMRSGQLNVTTPTDTDLSHFRTKWGW